MERVAIAKLVMAKFGKRHGQRTDLAKTQLPVDRPEVPKGKETRDIAAKKAGFSSTAQLIRAEVVHDKGVPERRDAIIYRCRWSPDPRGEFSPAGDAATDRQLGWKGLSKNGP